MIGCLIFMSVLDIYCVSCLALPLMETREYKLSNNNLRKYSHMFMFPVGWIVGKLGWVCMCDVTVEILICLSL